MTFQDIFKSSFLNNIASITAFDMILSFLFAFCLGILIFFVYKNTFSGVMYSSSFGISLIGLSLITTLVMLSITSNVVLSLGMVGALSIVRFRTAIKEPMDIVFLFWSIAIGIVIAAGLILLAVFGSIFIAFVLIVFAQKDTFDKPYILILHCSDEETEKETMKIIKSKVKKISLKSKTVTPDNIELNYEIRIKEESTKFVNEIEKKEGVNAITLVSYNGDYMG
ncbi:MULTISPECIES: DUF4956 domain-containing protein [Anaerofustis]|uniref:DUF4956 domain-containing protein n=1 Tax=Anaerofustis TaxID=264995 RepID=UPI0011070AE5|nr:MULTISPECIES: DUF4956 domain-containing protein [Anaerofustis]MCO8192993.1 DUF4956 domain-containing protein [Anaerofustis sp. NSJ-163]